MRIQPLHLKNTVLNYDWGSTTAIPELFGLPNPHHQPMAELWMGAHPKAPSLLVVPEAGDIPLPKAIEHDPIAMLGRETAARFDNTFPFLFKVLAAAKPLSIQAHPSLQQAQAGYQRENAAGIPLTAPNRCYLDQNHKPELLCALTPFDLLCGFRPAEEIAHFFQALGIPALKHLIEPLMRDEHGMGLKSFFGQLMALPTDERRDIARTAAESAARHAQEDPAFNWVQRLFAEHPGAIGILAPLFLNLGRLMPGEGIFLAPGGFHAYLQGVGMEVMANSDNVLRGGLTTKYIDSNELLKVLNFESQPLLPLKPIERRPAEYVFETSADEFELAVIHLYPSQIAAAGGRNRPEILFCTKGNAVITGSSLDEPLELNRGQSIFIPAQVPEISIEGAAEIFKASVP